jgi:hypothetical protein
MKNLFKIFFLYLIFIFTIVSCEKSSQTLISIPAVRIECANSDSTVCSTINNGKLVRVVMTRSGCANQYYEPVATGSTYLTCISTGCSALISNWTDSNNNSVNEILTGSMDICGLIDLNDNLNEDTGEVRHSSDSNIQSSAQILLTNWTDI